MAAAAAVPAREVTVANTNAASAVLASFGVSSKDNNSSVNSSKDANSVYPHWVPKASGSVEEPSAASSGKVTVAWLKQQWLHITPAATNQPPRDTIQSLEPSQSPLATAH